MLSGSKLASLVTQCGNLDLEVRITFRHRVPTLWCRSLGNSTASRAKTHRARTFRKVEPTKPKSQPWRKFCGRSPIAKSSLSPTQAPRRPTTEVCTTPTLTLILESLLTFSSAGSSPNLHNGFATYRLHHRQRWCAHGQHPHHARRLHLAHPPRHRPGGAQGHGQEQASALRREREGWSPDLC